MSDDDDDDLDLDALSDDDEWDETTADKTPVERLQEELQQANVEFQRQRQLFANKPKTDVEEYFAKLRQSRNGMTFKEWLQDASLNKVRHHLYEMYKKLVGQPNMPAFGKNRNE